MKKIMSKNIQDLASKKQFHWTTKVSHEDEPRPTITINPSSNPVEPPKPDSCSNQKTQEKTEPKNHIQQSATNSTRKKLQTVAVTRLRSVLTAFGRQHRANFHHPAGLGHRVMGTLFGYRKGHVHFAFQKEPRSEPAFMVEMATPICGLVREMASGLVRIALECDKEAKKQPRKLLEEPVWRTFCNGKKCGSASRKKCGEREWRILKALEPISTGAGVLPGKFDRDDNKTSPVDGEIMYMRAKFERVVGSRDSEAFYMMNPDRNGAPELSIYLLRL